MSYRLLRQPQLARFRPHKLIPRRSFHKTPTRLEVPHNPPPSASNVATKQFFPSHWSFLTKATVIFTFAGSAVYLDQRLRQYIRDNVTQAEGRLAGKIDKHTVKMEMRMNSIESHMNKVENQMTQVDNTMKSIQHRQELLESRLLQKACSSWWF